MRSGLLRNLLTIETYEEDTDETGQPIEDWKYYCKAWGNIRPLRGDHYWASQQAQSDVTGEVDLRYIPGLVDKLSDDVEKVRVKYSSRVLQVKSFFDPDERGRKLRLMVKEVL